MQAIYYIIPESKKEHIDKFLMKLSFRVTKRLHKYPEFQNIS